MAYYASSNIPEAEELISVSGPETACMAFASTASTALRFVRWELVCDYCGRKLYETTENSFTTDLTRYYTQDHPGPFHLLAVYLGTGPNRTTVHVLPIIYSPLPQSDSQPTIPSYTQPSFYISAGVRKYIPRGMSAQESEYKSNAFVGYSDWAEYTETSDYSHRTFYVSAVVRPRVGFRFVKFLYSTYNHGGSTSISGMFSFTVQTMSEGMYRIQVTRVGNVSSHPSDVDLQVYAIYEYTGIVGLTVKSIPTNYGTVDVVSEQMSGTTPYISQLGKTLVFVDKLLTRSYWDAGSGPNFDFEVKANDGVVAFKRWSDGGARSHRFTITEINQALIAYFSEGRLIFNPDNGNLLIYDNGSNALMHEHMD